MAEPKRQPARVDLAELMTRLALRQYKQIDGLEPALKAIVVTQLQGNKKLIAELEKLGGQMGGNPTWLKDLLERLRQVRDLASKSDDATGRVIEEHRKLLGTLNKAMLALSNLDMSANITPLVDVIAEFSRLIKGFDKGVQQAVEKGLEKPIDLSEDTIKKLRKVLNTGIGWREMGGSDIVRILNLIKDTDGIKKIQDPVEVFEDPSTTGDPQKQAVAATSTVVLAADDNRKGIILTNDSDEIIYLALGAPAVMNEGIRLNASGGAVAISGYTGTINAICASGGKNLSFNTLT